MSLVSGFWNDRSRWAYRDRGLLTNNVLMMGVNKENDLFLGAGFGSVKAIRTWECARGETASRNDTDLKGFEKGIQKPFLASSHH